MPTEDGRSNRRTTGQLVPLCVVAGFSHQIVQELLRGAYVEALDWQLHSWLPLLLFSTSDAILPRPASHSITCAPPLPQLWTRISCAESPSSSVRLRC